MVLKNQFFQHYRFLFLYILIFLSSFQILSAQTQEENDYWSTLISTAFENSLSVQELKFNYISAVINKQQYDYQWFPKVQFGFQNTASTSRSDYLYILNQSPESELTWVTTPAASISVYQKLPGGGNFTISGAYSLNYSLDYKAFIQYPQLQLSLNQLLGRGAFGITKNPEYQLMKEQMEYSTLVYKINLNSEILNILNTINKLDSLNAEENYYTALVKEYESEVKTSKEKSIAGLQSNLQTHYASHQYSEAERKLSYVSSEKESLLNNILIIIPEFDLTELNENRNELLRIILAAFYTVERTASSINKNTDSKIYESMKRQYLFQYRTNELSYAPELFISSTISPNSSITAYYSDWYKSLRSFKENKDPLDFSFTLGIKKELELPVAIKKRKEVYQLSKTVIENETELSKKVQSRELSLMVSQVQTKMNYLRSLEEEMETEQHFRKERLNLYNQNIITQDEFLQSETLFFQIYMDYINTFWECIDNQINVINLCDNNMVLLQTFLGDKYGYEIIKKK